MQFTFGVDYYPEHWPRERWATDARMMHDLGLDVARLAEFSWFRMEPEEGRFDFAWLDEAIDTLAREGVRVILGTPTAAPPAWIIARNPEIQPVDSRGLVHGFGGRHHDCQSNPCYRQHIRRFVTAFAEHFGRNPNVIGWQVDNELGNSHADLCHCDSCKRRFQGWLKDKYGDIDALNRRWGTAFWSQGYQDFSEISTPRMTAAGQNPSQLLDWRRFCADLVLEFHDFQAEIIRQNSPGRFITHNMMGFSDKFSYYELGKRLEFASHDQYPAGHFLPVQNKLRDDELAAELDFIRSVKDAPFAIMEQQSSITGWEIMGRAPKPGQLALWSLQSVAHGADAIVYFRWRSCAMGTEQYWHGLLPHSGEKKRNFREIEAFIREMKPIMADLKGAESPKQAAILFSYEQHWAMQIQPHHPDLRYVDHLMAYYTALHRRQIPVDFTPIDRPLDGYRLLIAPLWYLTSPETNQILRDYVARGGTLVLTMRAGVKDMDNLCICDTPLPCGLSDLAGVEVDEYDGLLQTTGSVRWGEETYPCTQWCDVMHTTTAEPVAFWNEEYYAGTPAITRNRYGKGEVWYVGTRPGEALAARLIQTLAEASRLSPLGEGGRGVELTLRTKEGRAWLFALNHAPTPQPVKIPAGYTLLTGPAGDVMAPYEGRIYGRNA